MTTDREKRIKFQNEVVDPACKRAVEAIWVILDSEIKAALLDGDNEFSGAVSNILSAFDELVGYDEREKFLESKEKNVI